MDWTRWFASVKDRFAKRGHAGSTTPAELLRDTQLFRNLSAAALGGLYQAAQTVAFRADELILKEGEVGDALFVIQSGAVRVFTTGAAGEEIVLARLEAGRCFGEQALLQDPPGLRNASVRAVSDVELLRIGHQPI